ncbi:MAG TPA: DUF4249 domain-containing protein [Cytophagaceae bacterium]|jgi:hypothetical protein
MRRKTLLKSIHAIPYLFLFLLISCDRGKEIEIPLPDYENQLVVECYLEPGTPMRMLLTESVSFFASPQVPLVKDALVTITHNGIVDTLSYLGLLRDADTTKIYNYAKISKNVEFDYTSEYSLYIKTPDGREVTGKCIIPKPVLIDSVDISYEPDDTLGSALVTFTDPPGDDYYRFILYRDTLISVQDVLFDENLTRSTPFVIKAGEKFYIRTRRNFNIKENDTHILALIHMDKAYFDYVRSIKDSRELNGNPFAQASKVKSNVTGGLGIFAGVSYDAKLRLPK